MKKLDAFKMLINSMRNNHEADLVKFKNEVAEASLYNLTYNIKWKFEDLVRSEELYKRYYEFATALDRKPDQDEVVAWLETDTERCQEQINMLALNNSTGMMHNTFEFAKLKATKEWMDFCKSQIKYFNRRDDK